MYQELNPFQPGAGLFPPELTGREPEILTFDRLIARSKTRHYERGMIFHGLRGVGKTVLLRHLQQHAERSGWVTLSLEGSLRPSSQQQLRVKLGRDLAQQTRIATQAGLWPKTQAVLKAISSLSLTLGFLNAELILKPQPDEPDYSTGVLEIDFPEAILKLASALKEQANPSALAIFIDEIQDLDKELLELLLLTQHEAGQKELPFYIIGAGLPSVPTKLGDVKTYAERLFTYREIGALTQEAAQRAFTSPIQKHGGDIEPDALDRVLEASQGYPYFIQQFGWSIWNSVNKMPITKEDVEAGLLIGRSELDSGFYRTRWDRTTEAEQSYLLALAVAIGDSLEARTSSLADQLGKNSNALSVVRNSLIEKGLIYSPAYGKVAFTVPGMREFVLRHTQQPGVWA